jgi:hypothetical protein
MPGTSGLPRGRAATAPEHGDESARPVHSRIVIHAQPILAHTRLVLCSGGVSVLAGLTGGSPLRIAGGMVMARCGGLRVYGHGAPYDSAASRGGGVPRHSHDGSVRPRTVGSARVGGIVPAANAVRARVRLSRAGPGLWGRCRQAGRVVALGVMVAWVAALPGWAFAAAAPSQLAPRATLQGAAVVAGLAAGRSFDRSDVTIIGDVDLRRLQVVRVGLRCQGCMLKGRLLGRDVRFTDVVDLSGSTVTGRVDLRGAIFERGLAWRGGVIDGWTSAGLAVFGDVLDADGLVFVGTADFTGTHFQAAASFAATDFRGPAVFDGATFDAAATFTAGKPPSGHRGAEPAGCSPALAGAFAADAQFTGATFAAAADFRGRCFHETASFSEVIVHGSAAFDSGLFLGQAVFEHATVAGNLSFRAARFAKLADLKGVVVGADLPFDLADLGGQLWLSPATVTGTLSFLGTPPGSSLRASELSTGGLVLDPANIDLVAGPTTRIDLLQRVEATARAGGQTGLADDARFTWLQEAGDQHPNLLDGLVYRDIAGYLVRPWYPVRALGIVILAGVVVNAIFTRRTRPGPARPAPEGPTSPPPADAALGIVILAAILVNAIFTRRTRRTRRGPARPAPPQAPTSPLPAHVAGDLPAAHPPGATAAAGASPGLRRLRLSRRLARAGLSVMRAVPPTLRAVTRVRPAGLQPPAHTDGAAVLTTVNYVEYWAGKVLFVVFLMCVANANPILHQFIDSLLSNGRSA